MFKINYLYFILILILISHKIIHQEGCYVRCIDCNYERGDYSNQNCVSCKYDFHFLFENDYQCYSREEVRNMGIGGYYVNSATNRYDKCHENCQTCTDGNTPTDADQQCSKCAAGKYKKIPDTGNNCYNPYDISNNYYKDNSNPPVFKECYYKCNTCSELGNDVDNKCDSCKSGTNPETQYYKLDSGETGNCYLINEIPDNYEIPLIEEFNKIATDKLNLRNEITSEDYINYASIYERIARKCYKNCKTCTQFGDDVNMNCITCKDGLYFYKNNCYEKCPKPETYQLKETNYQCKELVEGYKIVTEYKTSNDIVDFLLFHGLKEFDFEQSLITANKIYGQIYSLKNKKTNDELAEKLILTKISISDECLQKIIEYYKLKDDVIEDLILIKFDRNYTNSRSKYKSSVNQVDYYLFYPYYTYDIISGEKILNGTYTEIKLSICKDIEDGIKVIKPLVNKNESLTGVNTSFAITIHNDYNNYDIFLSSNYFFSDVCATFKSSSNRDVELAERREKYYQNVSFCDGNCVFSGFDYENYKVNCICDASLLLTTEQYESKEFKDRRNRIKNITFSTLSNKFAENISYSYVTLNVKTMNCRHLIFDINIAIKNFANWFALLLFIAKVVFLVHFLRRKLLPINEEYHKRKEKIEKEFLAQIPDADIMPITELLRIPKYHIERVIWSNYAGSFKYDKSKKKRKRYEQQKQTDGEANKFTYNALLMNRNRVEITGNELEDEDENDKDKDKDKKNNKNKKTNGNPPKRFGYIYTDDRADEERGQHYQNRNQVFKDAMKDLNYTEKEKDMNKFFEKDKNKIDFTNAIYPLSKEKLNNTYDENEKNNENKTNVTSKKKKTKRRKETNNPEKMDQMIKDLMPLDYDKVEVNMNDKIDPNRNEKLKFNVAKLNQIINEEYEFKKDQKARREFNEGKAIQEENRQHRNKLAEKNHNRVPENEKEKEEERKKKNLRKKKFGNQNYLEDPDEVAKYKKSYLDDEDLGENPFKIEPAINYRFSSMTSPEKLLFMKYNFAVDLDRRTFMEIYMGCVKMSQMIMNFIYIPYYHNLKFLKLYFFMFMINLNILTTTIFYSHYYISQMYGFKFLMCSLQSFFASFILYLFSFSKKKFTSVHVLDIWKIAYYKKVFKIIITLAIIVEFIISGFIWFISSAFCSVYQNSHGFYFLHLIESCIITLAFPFLFSFLPAFLRYIALVYEKKIMFRINDYVDIFF